MRQPRSGSSAWAAVVAALVGLVALVPAAAQTPPTNRWLSELRIANMAHGGGLREAPQGTMFAYATAVERGADVLEMDLHITRDGHVVAIHDSTVDRTTDGTGCVVAHTLAEIKALDAAHTFVPGRGPSSGQPDDAYTYRGVRTGEVAPPEGFTADDFSIVTLEELFRELPHSWMLMELKPTEVYQSHDCPAYVASIPADERPDLEAQVARLIDAYDMADKVMVASFVDAQLHRFIELAPGVDTSFPLGESVALYASHLAGEAPSNPHGHEAIQVPRAYGPIVLTEELVAYARSHGIAVHFWTINSEAEMTELLDWGIDGIITDEVQLLDRLLIDRGDPRPSQPVPPVATTTTIVEPTTTTTLDQTSSTQVDEVVPDASSTTVPEPMEVTVADPGPEVDAGPRGERREGGGHTGGRSGGGSMPSTGSEPAPLALLGGVLLAVGSVVVVSTRLRSRSVGSTTG